MANNASASHSDDADFISDSDIGRWQRLFKYSRDKARTIIEEHRADPSRPSVSDEHWEIVRGKMEKIGFDRETYDFYRYLKGKQRGSSRTEIRPPQTVPQVADCMLLLKLEGPFDTVAKVQEIARLVSPPEIHTGTDQDGEECLFIALSAAEKNTLLSSLPPNASAEHLTLIQIRITKARKELSSTSISPTLGVDATLAHLPLDPGAIPSPAQNQYPVLYFFYGTLAEPHCLTQHLGLSRPANICPAHIKGGKLRTWGGKYRALIDGDAHDVVDGRAFEVMNRGQEGALRNYVTHAYEVVRCTILCKLRGGEVEVKGLTFRFCGSMDQLDPPE